MKFFTMLLELLFRTPLSSSEKIRILSGLKSIFSAVPRPDVNDVSASGLFQNNAPASPERSMESPSAIGNNETNSSSIQLQGKLVKIDENKPHAKIKTRSVPAGKTNRMLNYASLAVGMTAGALSEATKRTFNRSDATTASNLWLSENNAIGLLIGFQRCVEPL